MNETQTIQEFFLSTLRNEKIPVSIFLINGIKLQGIIEAFDKHVIMLKGSITQKIYKHAIATIVPAYDTEIN